MRTRQTWKRNPKTKARRRGKLAEINQRGRMKVAEANSMEWPAAMVNMFEEFPDWANKVR